VHEETVPGEIVSCLCRVPTGDAVCREEVAESAARVAVLGGSIEEAPYGTSVALLLDGLHVSPFTAESEVVACACGCGGW